MLLKIIKVWPDTRKLHQIFPYILPQRLHSHMPKERKEFVDPTEEPVTSRRKRRDIISIDLLAFLHKKHSWESIKEYFKKRKMARIIFDQRFVQQRHEILGPDLASAHFILARGGKVKFKGNDCWMTYKDIVMDKIPSKHKPDMHLEAIDASGLPLCYEGLGNFICLYHMKQLIIKDCPYIDDWCLHRISNLFGSSLTHLDISGCTEVTERGICSLYRLEKLKTLVLNDTENSHKKLACLLLEDVLPECEIVGANYFSPSFLEQLKLE